MNSRRQYTHYKIHKMTIQDIIISTVITILPLWMLLPWTTDVCGEYIAWIYDWEGIYICDLKDWNQEFYINHELWHAIWSNITDKQKKQYERIYKLHHKRWINAFWREYGFNDVEESFCDDYASYMTKEPVNKYIEKRQKLILLFLTL